MPQSHICRGQAIRPAFSRRGLRRVGFTLVEALVAISLIALAGSALLVAIDTSTSAVDDAILETLAENLGNRLIEEALGKPFVEKGSASLPPNPGLEAGEDASPPQTNRFDDLDDYHDYATSGSILDPWGRSVGVGDGAGDERHPSFRLPAGYFGRWSLVSLVTYLQSDLLTPLPAGQSSPHRKMQVFVYYFSPATGWRLLAQPSRVVTYVAPPI